MENVLLQNVSELGEILNTISIDDSKRLCSLGLEIAARLKEGSSIFWCGNGGSAAESQHMAAELMGKFLLSREPYRSISITTDTSAITGIANDYNYSEIFSRQIQGLAKPGDFLICFSTSGESENVNMALLKAMEIGVNTVAFLGSGGGKSKSLSNYSFVVKSNITARIQEVHTLLGHSLCQLIEQNLESYSEK